jgi:GTP-binding protein era
MDLIAITIPADEKIGPGDRWILDNVRKVAPQTPLMGIVTKIDKVSRDQVALQLMALHKLLGEDSEVVPVSAVTGEQRDILLDVITSLLPEGPKFYPDDHVTDDDTNTRIAELVREAALSGLKDELPHSVAVEVDEIIPNPDRPGTLNVHVIIYVERPGQKTILTGKNGRRFNGIIHTARPQICKLLDSNVYLDLRIKVLKNWQSDPKQLGRLGF